MPKYSTVLSDDEILAVLAYIKIHLAQRKRPSTGVWSSK